MEISGKGKKTEEPRKIKDLNVFLQLVVNGSIAACATGLAMPIANLKVISQTDNSSLRQVTGKVFSRPYAGALPYTAKAAVAKSLMFTGYDQLQPFFGYPSLTGFISGFIQGVVVGFPESIATYRACHPSSSNSSTLRIMVASLRSGNILPVVLTGWRNGVFDMVFFTSKEQFGASYPVAAMSAILCNYPIDILRARSAAGMGGGNNVLQTLNIRPLGFVAKVMEFGIIFKIIEIIKTSAESRHWLREVT